MRVLHVVNTYLPVVNGVTVSVDSWARSLREDGHDVAVWTVGNEVVRDASLVATPGFGRLAPGFPIPRSLTPPREFRRESFDVVHAHHPVLLGPAAVAFARRTGAAVVATAHSDYLGYLAGYPTLVRSAVRPIMRARMRSFFESVDLVFTPSGSVASALESWGVEGPFAPTSYAVDVDALGRLPRSDARTLLGIAEETPLAVCVGRLAPEKRVVRLLEEFGRTLRTVPQARLVIIGDGPQLALVRDLAQRFSGSVECTGALCAPQLGRYYSAADVLVSASRNEVGPLVAIEAGLCGTGSVSYKVPGFIDRVTDGVSGRLVSDVPGSLGAALADVLAERSLAHLMGEAAASAYTMHTPAGSAELLSAGYERALSVASARAARPVEVAAQTADS